MSSSNNEPESESSVSTKAITLQKKPWFSLLAALVFVVLGIGSTVLEKDRAVSAAIFWFLGLPMVYLVLRYIWSRLCRDPFLSQSDTLPSVTWESFTSCPPDLHRTVPTLIFWTFVALCFAGVILSFAVENDALEPIVFIVVTYSGFGSLLILISAIWAVDALCLMYLFVVADKMQGRRGAAQDWWYRNKMKSRADKSSAVLTQVASGNYDMALQEDAESEKLRQLNQNRTSAKWRLAAIIALYVWWTVWSVFAAYDPSILEVNVPVPKLPAECDGYRLAMAADLHVGSMAGLSDTQWMVNSLNALEPDAIALVGDIGDRPVTDIMRKKLAPLAELKAPDGVYMSLGNHENYEGVEGYRKLLREESPFAEKIVLLENEHVMLSKDNTDGCSIALVGMADWSGLSELRRREDQVAPDFTEAIRSQRGLNGTTISVDEPVSSNLPMIMLQHQPKGMKEAAMDGVGLQLSGHTHGGQIWPQHITLIGYDSIAGLAEFDVGSPHGPSYLFVSEGVVGWGPRIRFLSQTDVTILTLRTPEAMKADGLEPDLSTSVATFAMYFALSTLPISLLLCLVPVYCWARNLCKDRSVLDGEKSEDVDVEGGEDAQ